MVQVCAAGIAAQSARPGALQHAWEWRVGGWRLRPGPRARARGAPCRVARCAANMAANGRRVVGGGRGTCCGTCETVRAPQGRNLTVSCTYSCMGKWPSCQICALSSSFYLSAVLLILYNLIRSADQTHHHGRRTKRRIPQTAARQALLPPLLARLRPPCQRHGQRSGPGPPADPILDLRWNRPAPAPVPAMQSPALRREAWGLAVRCPMRSRAPNRRAAPHARQHCCWPGFPSSFCPSREEPWT